MKNQPPENQPPPTENAGRSRFKRALMTLVLGLLALFIFGLLFLFTGSQVQCEGLADEQGPSLRCTAEVSVQPQAVWEAFTLTDAPRPYYFDAILEAEMRPGGRWRFLTEDRERFLAGGEILAIEPPRRFEHTFFAADLDEEPSRITVEIEALAGGSRVTLLHDGFEGRTATWRRFRRAHPLALSALKSFLETGELPVRARIYTAIFKPGMKTFTVRAEPWD